MQLQFFGGAGSVTGSKSLVTSHGRRILVDCGLYQGVKNERERNWQKFPIPVNQLDAIVLTHAHIDHSGYLPALVRQGYEGPVYCSPGTYDLCKVLLPDAGFLQEEDARFANKKGFSRHSPAMPLYTEEDARRSLKLFQVREFHKQYELPGKLTMRFHRAGHILGAASVELFNGKHMLVFSGDIGRMNDPVMYPPEPVPRADWLVLESTYGDRLHQDIDPLPQLEKIINRTMKQGGSVLIPAFAVGRVQLVLHMIQQLKDSGRIAQDIPVYLNSPMAITATEMFCKNHQKHKLTQEDCARIDANTRYVRTVDDSIALNKSRYPAIIISASGMASGGRVVHHLNTLAPDHRNSIVLMGFQAPGTRGEKLLNGCESIRIFGQDVPVKASVHRIDNLSAHGDYEEILSWLGGVRQAPKKVLINHGTQESSEGLAQHIRERFGWEVEVACMKDLVVIPDGA
ncbi:MBL fold metallo-hydrolase RNA specificity domain-containing protein [Sansalvadorimonas verongulae]|uniref:MBL fold metallo-hydrolase RNA specificity domain-containing protein n=1 Tax=Sansalvadorimonas verongulae TaxID=2172824 RepID=UPI0012BCF893|nr:MBL fold metallo-hydrolase [Sansalvadorimonas verongulae]MTI15180.1 MBL fold metallo-hydrolase [Sansalvadorimonas verongulae]